MCGEHTELDIPEGIKMALWLRSADPAPWFFSGERRDHEITHMYSGQLLLVSRLHKPRFLELADESRSWESSDSN